MKLFLGLVVVTGLLMAAGVFDDPHEAEREAEAIARARTAIAQSDLPTAEPTPIPPTATPNPPPTWANCEEEEDYRDYQSCYFARQDADWEWQQRNAFPNHGGDDHPRCYPTVGCE